MSQQVTVTEFIGITGQDDKTSRQFLTQANWNLMLALSNYFDSGLTATAVAAPPSVAPSLGPTPSTLATPLIPTPSSPQPIYQSSIDDPIVCSLSSRSSPSTELPLRSISVRARVVQFIAQVEISVVFVNSTTSAMEAVFSFQQDHSTVHYCEVEIDGKIFRGKTKSKEEAQADYDDSIASGNTGIMVEKSKSKKKDLYKINVGNLGPSKEANIRLKYITELISEGASSVRLNLPITSVLLQDSGALNVAVDVQMNSAIKSLRVESNHAALAGGGLAQLQDGSKEGKVNFKAGGSETIKNPRETFSMLIDLNTDDKDLSVPRLIVEKGSTKKSSSTTTSSGASEETAIALTFLPNLRKSLSRGTGDDDEEEQFDPFCEIVFMIDRSGSMAGSRINQAKNALQLFLRSIPEGTQFNIIGFGSTHQLLFSRTSSSSSSTSCEYNSTSFAQANSHVDSLSANLGGTNILDPLKVVLGSPANPDYPRQVFLLTDGEVNNTEEVLDYVKEKANGTRIFTFGIGAEASPKLVAGLAKVTKGQAEFVASGQRLEPVVLRQLAKALGPVLKDVRVEWGVELEKQIVYKDHFGKSGGIVPPLFEGESMVVYALVNGDFNFSEFDWNGVKIKGVTADDRKKAIEFNVAGGTVVEMKKQEEEKEEKKSSTNEDAEVGLVHVMAAKKIIEFLEEDGKAKNKNEIIKLGVKYGIITDYTSIITVAEGTEAVTESMAPTVNVNKKQMEDISRTSEADDMMVHHPMRRSLGALQKSSDMNFDDLDNLLDSSIENNSSGISIGGRLSSNYGMELSSIESIQGGEVSRARRSEEGGGGGGAAPGGGGFGNYLSSATNWLSSGIKSATTPLYSTSNNSNNNSNASLSLSMEPAPSSPSGGLRLQPQQQRQQVASIFGDSNKSKAKEGGSMKRRKSAKAEHKVKGKKNNVMQEREKEERKGSDSDALRMEKDRSKAELVFMMHEAEQSAGMDLHALKMSEDESEEADNDADDGAEIADLSKLESLMDYSPPHDPFGVVPSSASLSFWSAHPAPSGGPAPPPPANYGAAAPQSQSISSNLYCAPNTVVDNFSQPPAPAQLYNMAGRGGAIESTGGPSPNSTRGSSRQMWSDTAHLGPTSHLSSAAAPAPRPAAVISNRAGMRGVDKVIQSQRFDGSWGLDQSLAECLGVSVAELEASVPSGVEKDVWATVVAVVLLEKHYAEDKAEWSLLVAKAKKWIRKQPNGSDQLSSWTEQATTKVSVWKK